jgi:hypothetical protein
VFSVILAEDDIGDHEIMIKLIDEKGSSSNYEITVKVYFEDDQIVVLVIERTVEE